jgi:hypothetical protein
MSGKRTFTHFDDTLSTPGLPENQSVPYRRNRLRTFDSLPMFPELSPEVEQGITAVKQAILE